MKAISAAALGVLICTAVVSASPKVKQEHRTAFFGEDIYIDFPKGTVGEVVFQPKNNQSVEAVLVREGQKVDSRVTITSLGHLVLEDVQKKDEGVYVIRNSSNPGVAKQLILHVQDCAVEQQVKYGQSYYIHLSHVEHPITLQFRPHVVTANQSVIQQVTEPPPVVLYNQTTVVAEEYVGRLSVTEKRVTLHSVRMSDEGSFTVLDREGKIRRRNCLNVREHQDFCHPTSGDNLKLKVYLHYSGLNIVYRPKSDGAERVILEQGVLASPLDPQLEGRVTVEGSELIIKKVQMSDSGVFRVSDLAGFHVADIYVNVVAHKLPPLTVAILSMLGLIAFMLLVCLLSCLFNIHKRKEKSKKLMVLAQQAGKGEGDAFRQVVHEAYSRFTEESLTQSVCEKPTDSTEVTIKGLEVSKPGRYQALPSDNFLELSDSGVEFTNASLPLDSDTDAATTYASHKPLLNAVSPTAVTAGAGALRPDSPETTVAPQGDFSASRTPDSATSASPASNPRSLAATAAATPDGSPCGAASPETASGGAAGSEGGAEDREAEQKAASAQST
ncbi:uncharacterized protein LOC142877291 isoform X1 [Nelusetta ayraudi]|uniref:uncharacterized protein LOC142877291 isoform X1 n=1 Tax=Nelusetta ayraudi TaxID=303726 RepID=UPI003F6ED820